MKNTTLLTSAALLLLMAGAAHAVCTTSGFTGPYTPGTWTHSGPGSAVFSTGLQTVIITGGDTGVSSHTDVTHTVVASGMWSFNWDYTSFNTTAGFDNGYYLLNGAQYFLGTAAVGDPPVSGSECIPVVAGDVIGWRVDTLDGIFGPGVLDIDRFEISATCDPCAPVPDCFGTALAPDSCLLYPLDDSDVLVPFFQDGPTGSGPAQGLDQHNDDDSATVPLPFTFDLYGDLYGGLPTSSCWINNNGNITFTSYFDISSPEPFPSASIPPMVAPFWADVDTGNPGNPIGDVWMKYIDSAAPVGIDTLVVTWENVGYFSSHADKRNTFQVAISDGSNPVMGVGNNVCFSYDNMCWTTGDVSGGKGGFGGSPATVGINRGNGVNFFQIGQFDHPGTDYDGPDDTTDGVSYLDCQSFCFTADCFTLGNEKILCPLDDTAPQCYTYSFDFTNQSGLTVQYVTVPLHPTPSSPITINPNQINLLAQDGQTLAPGETTNITLTICGGNPGDAFCINLGLVTPKPEFLACCFQDVCIELPECDCGQLSDQNFGIAFCGGFGVGAPISFTFNFTLDNLSPFDADQVIFIPATSEQATFAKDFFYLPPLASGDSLPMSVVIEDAVQGEEFCFFVLLQHPGEGDDCCCAFEKCITVPVCGPGFDFVGACCLPPPAACFLTGSGAECEKFGGAFLGPSTTCDDCAKGLVCPGDLNLDSLINGLDLALLLGEWTGSSSYLPCPPNGPADCNQDCHVNGVDLGMMLGAWGTCK